MGNILRALLQRFSTKKLEVVLVGLENSGKSTLLQVLGQGSPVETAPTIGLNVKMVKRGGVQMKCWDLGGQAQYRAEWGRYTRGCNVIIFVVDSHEVNLLPDAKAELHRLLEDRLVFLFPYILAYSYNSIMFNVSCPTFRELATTPLLVVANKIDLEPHCTEQILIKGKYS